MRERAVNFLTGFCIGFLASRKSIPVARIAKMMTEMRLNASMAQRSAEELFDDEEHEELDS